MHNRVRRALPALLLTAIAAFGSILVPQAAADSAGTVHFVRFSEPSFDQYLESPSPSTHSWINAHIWRMGVYAPYFNDMTSWYPNGWLYKDAYALYTNEDLASQHPEWVLHDSAGSPLYIQWGCSNGTCPQYAANIASQAYRQWWIGQAKTELAAGYRGLFVDDVNMEMRVSNGSEEAVAPIDPSTGQAMTAEAWRAYMAQFMGEIQSSLPGIEIVHNAIWFSDEDAGITNPSIRSEISSSNYIFLERGANDSGLTGGDGRWSLDALLSFVDQVHSLGKGVVLDGNASSIQGMEYNLSSYFLVSTGDDAVSAAGQTPENWWAAWNTNLGEAAGPRYSWNNLLRRDFDNGIVLVNPPDEPTRTVSLPAAMQNVKGETVTSVTLSAASGAILLGTAQAQQPTIPQLANSGETLAPTQTTIRAEPLAADRSTGGKGASASTDAPQSGPASYGVKSSRASSSRKPRTHMSRILAIRAKARKVRFARRHLRIVRIKGSVKRATYGRVTIQLDALQRRHWVQVTHLTAKIGSRGHFTQLIRLDHGVEYRVRAAYSGARGYHASCSPYRQITSHPSRFNKRLVA